MLKKFNRWFDGLPEPRRFFIFLALMGWLPLVMMPAPSPILHAIGIIWLSIIVVIALSRL